MIKCDRCQGDKVIIGMGAMKEKCSNCKGKGFIAESNKVKSTSKKDESK